MDASFVLITQDYAQRAIPINRPKTVIGRQTDCNIRIPSADVSRQHCEVLIEGDAIQLKDLGSSNGTFVNRKKVTQTALSAGDLISVGSCVFVVRLDGDPETIDAEEAYEEGAVATAATSGGGAEAPTIMTKPAKPPAAPPPKSVVDDDDEDKNDDSDAFDFDFSDDDDEKKKPKK